MAERRMFAKTIVTSDEFLDMPTSTRCLYFTLGMFADDDGFVNNPKSIIRQIGASVDDMNILVAKKFVLVFEDGVIVIKHWRIHNYIQNDRKKDTKYVEHKETLYLDENKAYTQNIDKAKYTADGVLIDNVSKMYPQDRLGKISIIEEKKEIKKRTTASVDTPKKKYGTYSHILLTETQYERLVADFGEQYANACINGVDEYIQMKGAKYKDHNLVIRKAIREGWSCIPERKKEQVKTARDVAGDKAQEEWKEKELLLSNPRYAELDKRVRQLTLASVNGENVAEELLACKEEMSRLRNKILKGEV